MMGVYDKSVQEMRGQILDLKKLLMNLRFQKASGSLSNTAQIKGARKEIARLKTAIFEKKR